MTLPAKEGTPLPTWNFNMPTAAIIVQSTVENSSVLMVAFSSLENGVREPAYLVGIEVANSLNITMASVLVNKLDSVEKPASLARVKQANKRR